MSLKEGLPSSLIVRGWTLIREGKALEREFVFDSFLEAFSFLTQVALVMESIGHFSEIYNNHHFVIIQLSTPETQSLSKLDLKMARRLNELYERWEGK